MLNGGGRTISWTVKRSLSRTSLPRSFDLDLVTSNYEEQTRRATVAPRNGDALARQRRIKGGEATWLPGMDHAGIATQSVVERELWRREKKTRREMGRDEFVRRCEDFAGRNATVIRDQMARMGATLQWDSEYYTLDQRFSSAVTRAFVTLHGEGLISRDKRFVHWSPALRSSLSDQEVDKVDLPPGGLLSLPSPDGKGRREVKLGVMHTVRYELVGGGEGEGSHLLVATTRPETIYADIALAVHPSHPRVNELRGRRARNPLDGRELAIVVDEAVLADKGTGVLKITPAHDRLDAAIAARHWEEIEEVEGEGARERSCIDSYGRLRGGTPLDGVDRFDARVTVLDQLRSMGALIESREGETTTVALCSRTGDVIEPRQTRQWFLDCREMHAEAAAALRDGRISILPSSQAERLADWFGYAEPWCLSRQLVWGHRIPAWKSEEESEWIVACSEEEARGMRRGEEEGRLRQDKDVLDTWFSSGLVPLVCGGWTGEKGGPQFTAPPLSLLETGGDILGFWVARMVILTMRLSGGQLPFARVILHGMVRDAEGRKMSKSIGNVVDPLDVIDGISLKAMEERLGESALSDKEKATALSSLRARFPTGIPRCGPDALRFALLRHDVLASDVPIDIGGLAAEGLRFCNKLWNLAAYAGEVRAKVEKELAEGEEGEENVMDAWLLSRLSSTLLSVDGRMEETAIHLAFGDVHSFILKDVSDVYVESTKTALWSDDKRRLVAISRMIDGVMKESLRQLSVFMPFVSHFLHERIAGESVYERALQYSPAAIHPALEGTVAEVLAAAAAARSLKQQLGVPNRTHFQGVLHSSLAPSALSPLLPLLSHLAAVSIDTVLSLDTASPEGFEHTPVPGQNARLALKVEECHREEMRRVMEEKLMKATEKKELYVQKAARYEEIAREERSRGEKRERYAAKNEKKASQARAVAESAEKEEERIRAML